MKKYYVIFIVGMICMFTGYLICDDEGIKSTDPIFANFEIYLKNAEIGPLGNEFRIGRRENYRVNLNYEGEHRLGLFSFTDRQRGKALLADSYKYVIAAYELDKLLGGNIVWPVVEREKGGRKGGLQIFIEEPFITELDRRRRRRIPKDPLEFKNKMENIKVFSALVYSEWKLSLKDILILLDQDWRVIRVDLSEAFNPIPGSLLDYEIKGCSKVYYDNLNRVEDSQIESALLPYLNSVEIEALIVRKNIILKKLSELIKRLGEDNVLFEDN